MEDKKKTEAAKKPEPVKPTTNSKQVNPNAIKGQYVGWYRIGCGEN